MGPLPRSKSGKKFIVTFTDLFAKFVVAKALADQNAAEIAKFLVLDVFLKYSVPHRILSDRGTPFLNALTTELSAFNVKRLVT